MKKLLHGLDNVEFYWDDILVHTRTWEEHIKALRELFNRLLANGRLMRWAMFLQSYNFRVEAIKGSENVGADYLSRVEE